MSKNIINAALVKVFYNDYVSEMKTAPVYANCTVQYKDNQSTLDVTIKLNNVVIEEEDDEIFFYCSGIDEFAALAEKNGEDFVVVGLKGFYK